MTILKKLQEHLRQLPPHVASRESAALITGAADEIVTLRGLVRRYRDEVPIGHQPHMIAHLVDEVLDDTAPNVQIEGLAVTRPNEAWED